MKLRTLMFAAAITLPLAGTAWAQAQTGDQPSDTQKTEEQGMHQKISMNELPDAVKTTVQRESKGKQVGEIMKAQRMGKTVYDVQITSEGGKGQLLEISDSGKVLKRSSMGQGMQPQGGPGKPGTESPSHNE